VTFAKLDLSFCAFSCLDGFQLAHNSKHDKITSYIIIGEHHSGSSPGTDAIRKDKFSLSVKTCSRTSCYCSKLFHTLGPYRSTQNPPSG